MTPLIIACLQGTMLTIAGGPFKECNANGSHCARGRTVVGNASNLYRISATLALRRGGETPPEMMLGRAEGAKRLVG